MSKSLYWKEKNLSYTIEDCGQGHYRISLAGGASYEFRAVVRGDQVYLHTPGGESFLAYVGHDGAIGLGGREFLFCRAPLSSEGQDGHSDGTGQALTPMPGRILKIFVLKGQKVSPGSPLFSMEAMKMEQTVLANRGGTVTVIHHSEGDFVEAKESVVELESN